MSLAHQKVWQLKRVISRIRKRLAAPALRLQCKIQSLPEYQGRADRAVTFMLDNYRPLEPLDKARMHSRIYNCGGSETTNPVTEHGTYIIPPLSLGCLATLIRLEHVSYMRNNVCNEIIHIDRQVSSR